MTTVKRENWKMRTHCAIAQSPHGRMRIKVRRAHSKDCIDAPDGKNWRKRFVLPCANCGEKKSAQKKSKRQNPRMGELKPLLFFRLFQRCRPRLRPLGPDRSFELEDVGRAGVPAGPMH